MSPISLVIVQSQLSLSGVHVSKGSSHTAVTVVSDASVTPDDSDKSGHLV